MNREETTQLISQTGIVPKKSKGQNFLTDERVAQRHVDLPISPKMTEYLRSAQA